MGRWYGLKARYGSRVSVRALGIIVATLRRLGFPVAAILSPSYTKARDKWIKELIANSGTETQSPLELIAGAGHFDERIVEYPNLDAFLRQLKDGVSILDIGMTSNNPVISSRIEAKARSLTFVNPRPDSQLWADCPTEVISAPLSSLNLGTRKFDSIVSISTLEHIGWSNHHYGINHPAQYSRPSLEPYLNFARIARSHLVSNGKFFLTFPVGKQGRNLHPKTFRFGSQTLGAALLQEFLEALDQDFSVQLRIWSVEGPDWICHTGPVLSMPSYVWKRRYGQFVPAASSVAVVTATLRSSAPAGNRS